MSVDSSQILVLLKEIESKLDKRKSWYVRLLHFLEKLFIPGMLAVLAWIAHISSQRIASAQLELSNSDVETKRYEAKAMIQIKLLEFFYKDINGSEESRRNAMLLLKEMDPDLQKTLAKFVVSKSGISPEEQRAAQEILDELANADFNYLSEFKVGFYPVPNSSAQGKAKKLHEALTQSGFSGPTQVYFKDNAFFDRVAWPVGIEVRYEPDLRGEREAALLLRDFYNRTIPDMDVSLRRVKGNTRGFISVYIE